MTDGSFPLYADDDDDDDHGDEDDDQDEWCDDDHVGEEGVDRWQLSLAGAESHPRQLLLCSCSALALLCLSNHPCSAQHLTPPLLCFSFLPFS